jgi:hypothetical protein
MTPKEKAKELYDKFLPYTYYHYRDQKIEIYNTKQCALIAVDEILNFRTFLKSMPLEDIKYWQEVKQEIELL